MYHNVYVCVLMDEWKSGRIVNTQLEGSRFKFDSSHCVAILDKLFISDQLMLTTINNNCAMHMLRYIHIANYKLNNNSGFR